MRWAFLLGAGAAALAACNSDQFVDTDGGADSNDEVPVVGGDGGSTDGAVGDASGEATAPKRFCDLQDAQFCADFDTPGDAGAGFTTVETNGWHLAFQGTQVKSAPMALQSTTTGDAGGMAEAYSDQLSPGTDAGPTSLLQLDLDVRLPSDIPPATTQPMFVFTAGAFPGAQFMFGLAHEGQWELVRGDGAGVQVLSPQPTIGEWGHATLTIKFAVSGGQVLLALVTSAGTSQASIGSIPTIPGAGPIPAVLHLGGSCQVPAITSYNFFYDNVVAHWQ